MTSPLESRAQRLAEAVRALAPDLDVRVLYDDERRHRGLSVVLDTDPSWREEDRLPEEGSRRVDFGLRDRVLQTWSRFEVGHQAMTRPDQAPLWGELCRLDMVRARRTARGVAEKLVQATLPCDTIGPGGLTCVRPAGGHYRPCAALSPRGGWICWYTPGVSDWPAWTRDYPPERAKFVYHGDHLTSTTWCWRCRMEPDYPCACTDRGYPPEDWRVGDDGSRWEERE